MSFPRCFCLSNDIKQLIHFVSPLCDGTGPGLNLAQSSLWLACAMSLTAFNIEKYVDEFGNVIEPEIHYTDGTVRYVPGLAVFSFSRPVGCLPLPTLFAQLCLPAYWLLVTAPRSATLLRSSTPSNHGPRRVRPSSLQLSCEAVIFPTTLTYPCGIRLSTFWLWEESGRLFILLVRHLRP